MSRLNDQLLEAFLSGFYGFGNYRAPYWLVGMEEGGGDSFEAIARQLDIWDRWGQKELLDVAEYARAMNITRWYGDTPKLQPTWKHLIRVVLTAEGQSVDSETMRQYQKNVIGTRDGNTCLLELMPLPAPSISSWLYKDISALPYLLSRATYQEYVMPFRVAHLQKKIEHHRPQAVVFYGLRYNDQWKVIAGVDYWETAPEGVRYAVNNSTLFISSSHPVGRGASNQYFINIGNFIRRSNLTLS